MITISDPATPAQLDAVRKLMRAFVAWHRERHVEDLELIDEYFDAASFEQELAALPGEYARPGGSLLLAEQLARPAGCVALRAIDDERCEMKRMFVYPRYHRQGIGRALAEAIIDEGREVGYTSMLLDTSVRQIEAIGLYKRLGFRVVEPYYDVPKRLRDWLVFMELAL
jgi:putative acetyltransferase